MPALPTECPHCGHDLRSERAPVRSCPACRRPFGAPAFFSRPLRTLLAVFVVAGALVGGIVGVVTSMQPADDAAPPVDGPVARGPEVLQPWEPPAEPDGPPDAPLPPGVNTRLPVPKLPPKVPFKRYAVTPLPITPAPLADELVSVPLPGVAGESCVGGGGRFLVLHIPAKRQLAVFDVSAAKVVKVLPLAAESVHFAAGMNKLFVGYPDAGVMVRYDLLTQAQEATLPLKVPGRLTGMSMGYASAGPLLVTYTSDLPFKDNHFGGGGGGFLLDPFTLARYDVAGFDAPDPRGERGFGFSGGRLGPDGTTLVSGWYVRTLGEDGIKEVQLQAGDRGNGGHLLSGPDGTFHTGAGRFGKDGKPLGSGDRPAVGSLPAAHGSLYVQVHAESGNGPPPLFGQPKPPPPKRAVEIRDPNLSVPLAEFPVPMGENDRWGQPAFLTDPERYLLVPDAKALVVRPHGNDKLVVHRFDHADAVKKLPDGTLAVTSRPGAVTPGAAFGYPIAAHSKKGGLKFKLDSGPKGLSVAPDGKVTWDVPKDFVGPEPVIVTVTDGGGKEAIHSFDLTAAPLRPAPPPYAAVPVPLVAEPPTPFVGPSAVRLPGQPFDMPATSLAAPTTLPLPGEADASCLGGGGRFLLLRLPKLSQLAVLDLCLGKVVKYVPLPAANAPFAAGMGKVFVYDKAANEFQRWDLRTLVKERTVANPTGGSPHALAMGHAVDGPLFALGRQLDGDRAGALLNPSTFRVIPVGETDHGDAGPKKWHGWDVRASADGRVYSSPEWGIDSYHLRGSVGQPSAIHDQQIVDVVPGPDGLIGTSDGVYTTNHFALRPSGAARPFGRPHLPATSGGWFLRVSYPPQQFGQPQPKPVSTTLSLTLPGEADLDVPLPIPDGLDLSRSRSGRHEGRKYLSLAERLVLNPRAGVLAGVSAQGDSVTLVPVNPKELVSAAKPDRVLVLSRPPMADAGKPWAYTPDIWSPSGSTSLTLVSGPAGMSVAGGTATWTPPADYRAAEVTVVLSVAEGAERETFHSFALPVRNGGSIPPKENPDGPDMPEVPPIEPPVNPPVGPKPPVVPPPPPKPKLVSPPVTPVPITPASIPAEGLTVKLPGEVRSACVGGGGRYLFLHLEAKKQLAVFDVSLAKVVKLLPLADGPVAFAAGMNVLAVVYPDTDIATGYDLSTLEKRTTKKLALKGRVSTVAMGSASAGPLVVHAVSADRFAIQTPVAYLDPRSFVEFEPPAGAKLPAAGVPVVIRCSPDGTVIALADAKPDAGLGGLPTTVIVLRGDRATAVPLPESTQRITPGPDGTLHGFGSRYSLDGKPLAVGNPGGVPGKPPDLNNLVGGGAGLPAESGSLFVRAEIRMLMGPKLGSPDQPPWPVSVQVLAPGGARPLVSYADLPGVPPLRVAGNHGRVHVLVPEAGAFVYVDPNAVVLRKFDLDAALKQADFDYLLVASRPGGVTPGAAFEYRIDVKSKKGGLKFALEAGPSGLAVSADGKVTWAVPNDYAGTASATVTVSDASGAKVSHAFALHVGTATAYVPPAGQQVLLPEPPPPPPEKHTRLVQPPAKPLDIPPTKLTETVAVKLDEPADAKCLGGGGRYLILRLPKAKQLAVLDLSLGKEVKRIPLPDGKAPFAAGAGKLFVYAAGEDSFQRWSLDTFEKEATVKSSVGGTPLGLLMGHSVDGPLAVHGPNVNETGSAFLNPVSFKAIVSNGKGGLPTGEPSRSRAGLNMFPILSASGDGRVYGWHFTAEGDTKAVRLSGLTVSPAFEKVAVYLFPGPDGLAYTLLGLHTADGKPAGHNDHFKTFGPMPLPATSGPLLLLLDIPSGSESRPQKRAAPLWIGLVGDENVKVPVPGLSGFGLPKDGTVRQGMRYGGVSLLHRFDLCPPAGVLAVLNDTRDTVHLHPLKLKELLRTSDAFRAAIVGDPPAAVKGKPWQFAPEVWTKKDGEAVELSATGPAGLSVEKGTVKWAVPPGFAETEAAVTLVATVGEAKVTRTVFVPVLDANGK